MIRCSICLVEYFKFSFEAVKICFLGGERRLCPRNAHQPPEIVILASPNVEGLQAIAAARHLANHAVSVF